MGLGQERTGRDFGSLNNGVTYPDDREPPRVQAGGLGENQAGLGEQQQGEGVKLGKSLAF